MVHAEDNASTLNVVLLVTSCSLLLALQEKVASVLLAICEVDVLAVMRAVQYTAVSIAAVRERRPVMLAMAAALASSARF